MVFKPGQSGNPGGDRSPKFKQQAALLLPFANDAVQTLLARMSSDDESVSLRAACEVLDRVYGKPKQNLEHDMGKRLLNALIEIGHTKQAIDVTNE